MPLLNDIVRMLVLCAEVVRSVRRLEVHGGSQIGPDLRTPMVIKLVACFWKWTRHRYDPRWAVWYRYDDRQEYKKVKWLKLRIKVTAEVWQNNFPDNNNNNNIVKGKSKTSYNNIVFFSSIAKAHIGIIYDPYKCGDWRGVILGILLSRSPKEDQEIIPFWLTFFILPCDSPPIRVGGGEEILKVRWMPVWGNNMLSSKPPTGRLIWRSLFYANVGKICLFRDFQYLFRWDCGLSRISSWNLFAMVLDGCASA